MNSSQPTQCVSKGRPIRRWIGRLSLIAVVLSQLVLTGCEDSDSSDTGPSIADLHDFGTNNRNLIVAMGDSITEGVGGVTPWPARLSNLINMTVINEGYGGEHAYEGKARVVGVLAQYQPGYLLILYGANDLLHAGYADRIAEDIRAMVLAAKANKTIPIVATMTPMARSHGVFDQYIPSINHFIRAMAAEENVEVVDLEPIFDSYDNDENPYVMEADDLLLWDGLHPNDTGAWEMALAFEDVLTFVMTGKMVHQP